MKRSISIAAQGRFDSTQQGLLKKASYLIIRFEILILNFRSYDEITSSTLNKSLDRKNDIKKPELSSSSEETNSLGSYRSQRRSQRVINHKTFDDEVVSFESEVVPAASTYITGVDAPDTNLSTPMSTNASVSI